MGRIVVSENITLDGVGQDPMGEEGTAHGGWFLGVGERDRDGWAEAELAEALAAEALLLGRRSYEFFAARWPSRTGPWADRLNAMPKYVVTSSPEPRAWANTERLDGIGAVRALKRELDGEIVVYASFELVRALVADGLVDELRLIMYPSYAGLEGLRLTGARTVGDNLAALSYELG